MFTGAFWRLPTRVAMGRQKGRILGWKPQVRGSISKLPSVKARPPSLSPPRAPNAGEDPLSLGYEKPRSTPLLEYRCSVSAETVQGNYLHLFCGSQRTPHLFLSPPDSDKNKKENREVGILKAPRAGWLLRDS